MRPRQLLQRKCPRSSIAGQFSPKRSMRSRTYPLRPRRHPLSVVERVQPPVKPPIHRADRRPIIRIGAPIFLSVEVEEILEERHKPLVQARTLDRVAHFATENQVLYCGEMCQANQNYDLVTDLANAASIALPQSLLNWKPKVAR